jgi:DNA-binding transcriptional regulator YbjK
MPAIPTQTVRRDLLVQRAIELVAEGGLGAVTHRSVENAAGAPHGSVTYWFGSRDGLVAAMVDRLATECEEQAGQIAADVAAAFATGGPDLKAVATAVAAWIDDGRDMHLARLELELAAVRDPRLRAKMTAAASIFWRLCEPLAAATGSDDPVRDGRALASMVDGLLLDRLAHAPQSAALLEAAIARLLSPQAPAAGAEAAARG